ncbi:methyltransferase domain-containing protein [Geodermatophilus sp. YIM 151500]|uniref:class I SAM-dependent methyltransferase n=1 Tax=Geodermatophilus sp. YIM 151500 TaxID=2984531 RepID=UPI0021E4D454|nr:methyltransferase domain-containing protein [Geodermatophilus sp. YIM 151500]MCV2490724.1 methyltransferase domain-containing protein [Geodermatophilus sp. YIM 151500]
MTEHTGRTTDGAPPHGEREYLPPMAKSWLLPLYDPVSRFLGVGKVHRRLLAQAALQPGQRVLEIGCGTGNLLLEAKAVQPGASVTGLDPDAGALARARRKARRRGLAVDVDRGFADALPYPDDSVDVALSAFMLHHVPAGEREPAVHELLRVLRPGGRLHLVDLDGHEQPGDGHVHPGGGRRTHRGHRHRRMRDHAVDGIDDLLRRAGFPDVAEVATEVRRHTGRITYYRATR